ncbi:prolactin-7B1-like [Acomys russatus]|uniref:prolactin-7B1-like n=1 Tax=Acomys russatus TaxID=60746 RepID=UPI0021E31915|nr:prolactin-7B1-like [Acomys russatus]
MLLMSNLLLWEKVDSASINASALGNGEVHLKELFDDAIIMSKNISEMATESRRLLTLELLEKQELMVKTFNSCHTFSLKTPETMEEAKNISREGFLKMILSILHAWDDPLHHLLMELDALPGAPDTVLSIVKDIEIKNKGLQEHIMRMLSKVHPGTKESEDYPVWSGLASLKSAVKESQFFALYKLFYCLHVDTDKVDTFLRLLRCVHVRGDICYDLEDRDAF